MGFPEKGVAVKDLPIDSLKHLLISSRESVAAFDIPISGAIWDSKSATLMMKMVTSTKHQGFEGICFGGFTAALLDLTSGFAGFIKAAENGQIVLSKHLEVDFLRPLPVGILIEVVAKVEGIQDKKIRSSAKIFKKGDDGVIARGVLEMKLDDGVRLAAGGKLA